MPNLDGNSDVVKRVVLPTRRFPHIYGFNVKQSAKCFTVSAVDRHRRLPGSEFAGLLSATVHPTIWFEDLHVPTALPLMAASVLVWKSRCSQYVPMKWQEPNTLRQPKMDGQFHSSMLVCVFVLPFFCWIPLCQPGETQGNTTATKLLPTCCLSKSLRRSEFQLGLWL